jgi:hypothetical protein
MENKELERIIKELREEIAEEERKRQEKEKKDGKEEYKYFNSKMRIRYLISIVYKDNIVNYMRLEKLFLPEYPSFEKFNFEVVELNIDVKEIKDGLIAITFKGETKKGENDKRPFEAKFSDINTVVYVGYIPGFIDRVAIEESIKEQGIEKTFMYLVKSLQNHLLFGFPIV